MSLTDLRGKVAIVTGASSGIGRAVAKQLASSGVKVALAARRAEMLVDLKAEIESSGEVAITVPTDVVDVVQVKRLVDETENKLGDVDILVNNAGVMYYTLMKNLHVDEWNRQVDVNVKGVLNGIGCVLEKMLKRKTGHIVNMSSNAARKGFEGLAVYSGTKFFIEGLCQGMRAELKGSGVRITNIQPGDVETELLQHTTDKEALGAPADGSVEVLKADDIARAVVFALQQPAHVAINEILVEPRDDPCF